MHEIYSFLGSAGYYRRFADGFSSIAGLLTKLTQKNTKSEWSEVCEKSFQELKDQLVSTLVLTLPSRSRDFFIYCDALGKG